MATMHYPSSTATSAHSQMLSSPPPYPKIVSLLGAETQLGSRILLDLLNSPQVSKVYAIAFSDALPVLSSLKGSLKRKARVVITDRDRLDKSLSRITECDIAFCVQSTERHASSTLPPIDFYALNYGAPTKFISHMYHLGVLNVCVLSHLNADTHIKSEFYNLKAQLEQFIKVIRKDAGSFGPIVTIFKMPSNIMANELVGAGALEGAKDRDKDVPQVLVKDVAAAMEIDAFYKANTKAPPGVQRKKPLLEIFDPKDVHRILDMADYQESWYPL